MISDKTFILVENLYNKIEDKYNHKIRNYLKDQMSDSLDKISAKIEAVDLACQSKHTTKLHDYIDNIKEQYNVANQLIDGLNQKFMLFVMGNGKNGKSTLINALLEQTAAQEGLLPTTWKIDVFSESTSDFCVVKFHDGTQKKMSITKTKSYLQEEERKRKDSEKEIRKKIRELKKQNVDIEILEEEQKKLRKYSLYKSAVIEVEWPVSHSKILQYYRLVDTPGLRQELDNKVIASAKDYFASADGVIWILPGDKAASSGDYEELRQLCEEYKRHPDNIIAVINKIDLIRAKGQNPDDIYDEVKNHYGKMVNKIVPISAKEARKAESILTTKGLSDDEYLEGKRLLEQSNIVELTKLLNQTFFANALEIQINSKTQSYYQAMKNIELQSNTAKTLLKKVYEERRNKLQNWQKDSSAVLQRLEKELNAFKRKEANRIERETSVSEDELWDMESNQRNSYILDKIIHPENIEKKLKDLINHHTKELVEMTTQHVKQAPFYEFPALKKYEMTLSVSQQGQIGNVNVSGDLSSQEDSQLLLGSVLGVGAAFLLGPVGLLFAGFAATDTGKSISKWFSRTFGSSMANKVEKRFSNQMDDVIQKITTEYHNYIDKNNENISKLCENTYQNLYGPSEQTEVIEKHLGTLSKISQRPIRNISLKEIIFKIEK